MSKFEDDARQIRTNQSINTSFSILRNAIKKDSSYAYSWHANIAMSYYDTMPESFWMPDKSEHMKIANKAASRFMKMTFGVETSQDMLLNENTDEEVEK